MAANSFVRRNFAMVLPFNLPRTAYLKAVERSNSEDKGLRRNLIVSRTSPMASPNAYGDLSIYERAAEMARLFIFSTSYDTDGTSGEKPVKSI
jgi:hypothetical protein